MTSPKEHLHTAEELRDLGLSDLLVLLEAAKDSAAEDGWGMSQEFDCSTAEVDASREDINHRSRVFDEAIRRLRVRGEPEASR